MGIIRLQHLLDKRVRCTGVREIVRGRRVPLPVEVGADQDVGRVGGWIVDRYRAGAGCLLERVPLLVSEVTRMKFPRLMPSQSLVLPKGMLSSEGSCGTGWERPETGKVYHTRRGDANGSRSSQRVQ